MLKQPLVLAVQQMRHHVLALEQHQQVQGGGLQIQCAAEELERFEEVNGPQWYSIE